jgi:hypothetical protein
MSKNLIELFIALCLTIFIFTVFSPAKIFDAYTNSSPAIAPALNVPSYDGYKYMIYFFVTFVIVVGSIKIALGMWGLMAQPT